MDTYIPKQDKWHISDIAADYIYIGKKIIDFSLPSSLNIISDIENAYLHDNHYPIYSIDQIKEIPPDKIVFLS